MEKQEKLELMAKYETKLTKAIAREEGIKKELENDNATLKYLNEAKSNSTPLTTELFKSYDEWIVFIEKQIKKSENTLKNIEFKKVEIEAVQLYLKQE